MAKIVDHPALTAAEAGFENALRGVGHAAGATFERRNANGDMATLAEIAREFARPGHCDLIHSIATPTTQAILKTVKTTPVVFSAVTDPVAAGIVPADSSEGSRTGTHVTGISDKWPVALQMRAYSRFVPAARIWGTIFNPDEANSLAHVAEMHKAFADMGLTLIEQHARNAEEVVAAAEALAGRVQAIVITADNTSVAHIDRIAKVCDAKRIPLFAGDVDSVSKGAVAAYGMDYFLIGYAAGKKAALILDGVPAGEVPWGRVEKFSLVINRDAAARQGLKLSPDWLRRADRVIGEGR
ncbi:MAG: ABC transporter substrate-binding protein [Gammaproteobacteria bacterium]|nr:MAG: ABC transporter substrate-binding protein [Gammaproteobacteria bacterium]